MFADIAEKVINEKIAFRHLGEVKGGVEQPITEETKLWSGAMEVYRLTEENGTTTLETDMDAVDAYADYFRDKFPIALAKVKELAEAAEG